MSNVIYLTVKGKSQGLISSGCSTYDSVGNKYQSGHENEILVYSFEHDLTREQNVSHHPVKFIKAIDKSSPLFGMAISNNELLECNFDFYRTARDGGLEKYYSIELTDAVINNVASVYPNSLTHNEQQPYETVSVKYKSITWKHHVAGTSGYSIWDERIY